MKIQSIVAHSPQPLRRSQESLHHAATPKRSFESVFQSRTHTVRPGDTLSEIVRDSIKASGGNVSSESVYRGVDAVAKANNIRNANLIFVNQKIDLTALSTPPAARPVFAMPAKRRVDAVLIPMKSKPTSVRRAAVFNTQRPASPWENILEGRARLTSEFGMRRDPFSGDRRHHDGIDIAVRRGTGILAFQSGTVIYSGWKGGYGNTVIVRHDNGLETQYSHNARNLVAVGERVTSNTTLGLTGSTGRSTGPHLHFELRRGDKSIDPIPFLTRKA